MKLQRVWLPWRSREVWAPNAGTLGSVPGYGAKILYAAQSGWEEEHKHDIEG